MPLASECYTSTNGTSAKIRKSRRWMLTEKTAPCPFCASVPTIPDWERHLMAKHAPQDAVSADHWIKAVMLGKEIRFARNRTRGDNAMAA